MTNIQLYSLNLNGLRRKDKRLALFNRLKQKRGIILLQETHSTESTDKIWEDEWGGNIIFSHGTSNSNGVAFLLPPNEDHEISNIKRDSDGRFLSLDISINEDVLTLINVYAPVRSHKKDQLNFIKSVKNILSNMDNKSIIIGGDLNFYMSKELDKLDSMSSSGDNPEYREEIIQMLELHEMVDLWRVLNPTVRRYTWHARGLASRLDYWLVSEHLLNIVNNSDILPGLFSDHSLLSLGLGTESNIRGKGFWKFNNTLLSDPVYVQHIKELVSKLSDEYELLEDKGLKFEIIKMNIRKFTIPYCIQKRKTENEIRNTLESRLNELLPLLDTNDDKYKEEYYTVKNELEQLEKGKIRGAMIRSKARWVEEGERNTKFFLNLEKRNYSNKIISQLKKGKHVVNDKDEILKMEKDFYENLYSENLEHNSKTYNEALNYFHKGNSKKLNSELREFLEQAVTEKEILESLKHQKNSKTPGTDGLTSEFYKFFWIDLKTLLCDSITYAFEKGELSVEQKNGIITLLPKKIKTDYI